MNDNSESACGEPYSFSKEKLPTGLSYPLKRSLLDSALRGASVYGAIYSVRYLARRNPVVLDAHFVPLSRQAHPSVVGRSLITLWAVLSTTRHHLEQQILTMALPQLCDWLDQSQEEDSSWRELPHSIAFQLGQGGLVRTDN
jgi:hypothetical protein